MLNYIEGYARARDKVHRNFLEIAYGSLKESKYLLQFSLEEKISKQIDKAITELTEIIKKSGGHLSYLEKMYIIMSSSRDLGYLTRMQGAGLISFAAAKELALKYFADRKEQSGPNKKPGG